MRLYKQFLHQKFPSLEGIVAAHYKEGFAAQYGGAPVKDSMMQSYAEVEKILDLMNVKNESRI